MHKKNPCSRLHLIFLFQLFHLVPAYGQEFTKSVDSLMQEYFADSSYGASVLVSRGDEIIYHRVYGMASLELQVPMATDMVFQIGSLTKQFTAVCILKLFKEGRLSLNDSIKKFIAGYPEPAAFITLHQLLNQTSGIIDYLQIRDPANDARKYYSSSLELVNFFKDQPLRFLPGSKWEYSNSNYAVLGYFIEKISGKTYTQYLDENIFKPVEMNNSFNGVTRQLVKGRVPGYSSTASGEMINSGFLDLSYAAAGGSILSTTSDMWKWSRSLVKHKILDWETLVKAITNYSTTSGVKTHYGYGWFLNEINGSSTIEHSGGTRGFASHAVYLPHEDVFVVLLANAAGCATDKIATLFAAIAISKPYDPIAAVPLITKELEKFTGTYILEDGYSIKLSVEGNNLYVSMFGLKQEVIPFAKNKLIVKGGFAEFEFSGKTTADLII